MSTSRRLFAFKFAMIEIPPQKPPDHGTVRSVEKKKRWGGNEWINPRHWLIGSLDDYENWPAKKWEDALSSEFEKMIEIRRSQCLEHVTKSTALLRDLSAIVGAYSFTPEPRRFRWQICDAYEIKCRYQGLILSVSQGCMHGDESGRLFWSWQVTRDRSLDDEKFKHLSFSGCQGFPAPNTLHDACNFAEIKAEFIINHISTYHRLFPLDNFFDPTIHIGHLTYLSHRK